MKPLRAFTSRTIGVGAPSCACTTGWRAKISRARGREKRAKIRPVTAAVAIRLRKISTVATA